MQTKRVTKIKPFFKWFDLWIGAYIDKQQPAIYICPLPTVGVKIWREIVRLCNICDKPGIKTAVHTGDGWALQWECNNKDCHLEGDVIDYIEWDYGNNWLTHDDLEEFGFTVV